MHKFKVGDKVNYKDGPEGVYTVRVEYGDGSVTLENEAGRCSTCFNGEIEHTPKFKIGDKVRFADGSGFLTGYEVTAASGDTVDMRGSGSKYTSVPASELELVEETPAFAPGDKVRVKADCHCLELGADYTVKRTRDGAHGLCILLEELPDWNLGFYAWRFERAPKAAPKFRIGDKVTPKKGVSPAYEGTTLEVIEVEVDYDVREIRTRSPNGNRPYFYARERAPKAAPAFKVGDEVTLKKGFVWTYQAPVIVTWAPPAEGRVRDLAVRDIVGNDGWVEIASLELVPDPDPELKRALDYYNETGYPLDEAPKTNQALRHNQSKPESDYILTYAGGVDAVFSTEFDYYETLYSLVDVYVFLEPDALQSAADALLETLRAEANDCGDDIVALLADTNTRGGKKYAQGNYLKGANWRQYFQGAVRHAQHLQNGDERDDEGFSHRGNFFFNVLALHHCITTGIGTDDRVKAPK